MPRLGRMDIRFDLEEYYGGLSVWGAYGCLYQWRLEACQN